MHVGMDINHHGLFLPHMKELCDFRQSSQACLAQGNGSVVSQNNFLLKYLTEKHYFTVVIGKILIMVISTDTFLHRGKGNAEGKKIISATGR